MFGAILKSYYCEKNGIDPKNMFVVSIMPCTAKKSEKERLNIKNTLQTKMDMANRVQKFVDCSTKSVEERELFIVEGDSALGACKQARDPYFQAIMPVRGKILNCLKAEYDKIFKSEIITDLLKVLGCGVEVKTKSNKNLSNFVPTPTLTDSK